MAEVELQDFRSETRAWLDENCPDTVRGTGMLGGFGGGKKAPTPSSDFMKWFDRMWVSISPIVLISGQSPFCQCFFDDVKVPKEDLVGELDRGWTIAKRLLQHERASISGFSSGAGARATRGGAGSLEVLAKQYMGESNRIGNDEIRADVTKVNMGARAFQLTQRRAHEENREDGTPTFATSMFKLYGSELGKRRAETTVSILGHQGIGWEGEAFSEQEISATRGWLSGKAGTIAGGTSEVQLNIIAKRVLGLPD